MSNRTVLALDLSTARGEIAVLRGGEVLFEAVFQSERSHNAQVFAPLRDALEAAGPALDLIVVGTGPGSYTGVRIAIAAAQGVALSRGVPVIGLASIAAPNDEHESYRVVGDARRGSYYVAEVVNGKLMKPIEIVDTANAQARMESGVWLTFDPKPPFNSDRIVAVHPSAVRLARMGLSVPDVQADELLEPLYLQEAFITTARKAGKHVPLS